MIAMKVVVGAAIAVIPIGAFIHWRLDTEKGQTNRADQQQRNPYRDPYRDPYRPVVPKNWPDPQQQKELADAVARIHQPVLESDDAILRASISIAQSSATRCREHPDGWKPTIRGRVIVWETDTNSRSNAESLLPPDMRGNSVGSILTIFLVTEKQDVPVKTYDLGPADGGVGRNTVLGYRRDMTVCVVYMPAGTPAGKVLVKGDDPPEDIVRGRFDRFRKEYGKTDEALARWIKTLPRAITLPGAPFNPPRP